MSVVVPSFNQGRFIGRTIESILGQAHIRDIHVMDGGSTDDTLDVLAQYGADIAVESRPDDGQADAVNRGIAAATGEIIAWINSDDTYEPDAFDHVARIFSERSDVDVVYGEGYHIDAQDRVIERYPVEDFSVPRLFRTCFLCQPATFIRRSALVRLGGLRESLRYCLDYELWLRLATGGARFFRTDAFLANTRLYAETKTLGSRPEAYLETAAMISQLLGKPDPEWIERFAKACAEDLWLRCGGAPESTFRRARSMAERLLAAGTRPSDRRAERREPTWAAAR
jgi:glycosyltransferase involved in cell wall biosynthesis